MNLNGFAFEFEFEFGHLSINEFDFVFWVCMNLSLNDFELEWIGI